MLFLNVVQLSLMFPANIISDLNSIFTFTTTATILQHITLDRVLTNMSVRHDSYNNNDDNNCRRGLEIPS